MSSHNSNNERSNTNNNINFSLAPALNLLRGAAMNFFSQDLGGSNTNGFRISAPTSQERLSSALATLENTTSTMTTLNSIPEEPDSTITSSDLIDFPVDVYFNSTPSLIGLDSASSVIQNPIRVRRIPRIPPPPSVTAPVWEPISYGFLAEEATEQEPSVFADFHGNSTTANEPPVLSISRAVNTARNLENFTHLVWNAANEQLERRILRSVMEESFQEDQEQRLMEQSKPLRVDVTSYQSTKKEFDECRICIEKFEKDSKVCTLPCGHYFCENCIREWGKRKPNCPFCEAEIPLQDGTDEPASKKLKSQ